MSPHAACLAHRLYPAHVALPLLLSQLAFARPLALADSTLQRLRGLPVGELPPRELPPASPARGGRLRRKGSADEDDMRGRASGADARE